MTRVFLSYARNDLQVVQRLEQEIVAHGLTVWRDQDSIYGGQQWPKAIGEAIATHDRVVLVWSQHAARSHFVELEWNIALALQTSIIPCWLDQTPLPPALRATNGIDLRLLTEALPRLLKALRQSAVPPDAGRQASVVAQLAQIPPAAPAQVVEAVKATFTQQGWSVQGNVYQAGGDMHISVERPPAPPTKTWLERWQLRVAFVAALLAISSYAFDLPKKVKELLPGKPGPTQVVQTLAGVVWDGTSAPIAGVEIVLPEVQATTTTDQHGLFTLQVKATPQRPVRLIARKDGYEMYTTDATLGNTSLSLTLRSKP
jgi:hypothetical protein